MIRAAAFFAFCALCMWGGVTADDCTTAMVMGQGSMIGIIGALLTISREIDET